MPDSPASEPEPVFVCDCEGWMRSACEAEFYKEHGSKRYCVLHFPGKEKSAEFKKVFEKKLERKDFNFSGVWFPDELSFRDFNFSAEADFRGATFSAEADFGSATFRAKADFGGSTFIANANFNFANFSAEADFASVTFGGEADFGAADFIKNVTFIYAAFRAEAYFRQATFGAEANFSRVTFDDYVRFAGEQNRRPFLGRSSLDLQFTRIEKPDHVSFHMLTLRPHWFLNVDARVFDFVNVKWGSTLNKEIKALIEKEVETPHRLLAIACWQLAVNAEENHRYEEASKFRFMAMDARRLQLRERMRGSLFKAHWRVLKKTSTRLHWSLRRDWGVRGRTLTRLKRFIRVYGKSLNLLYRLYWMVSGYGERITRASAVLVGIWFISALLYILVDFRPSEPKLANESKVATMKQDDVSAPLRLGRALTYSAGVMTLQKPEPRPATTAAQTVFLVEMILGPVQAALLALAIRRKFMR